jgi:membrane protease YdiL (CAAX protease family)
MNNQLTQWLQIILLFPLPILLIYFNIVPYAFRWGAVAIVMISIIAIFFKEKTHIKSSGLRIDNILTAVPFYGVTLFSAILGLAFITQLLSISFISNHTSYYHFYGPFLLVAFLEVFLYLGFLLPRLEALTEKPWLAILIASIIFAFMHMIYPSWLFVLMTFPFGLALFTAYHFRPNLILAAITLATGNFMAVLYGFGMA